MGAPPGNTNAKKANRLLTSSLRRELTQNPDDVLAITRRLIDSAKAGEPWAQALVHDRSDGKAPQPIVGDDDEAPLKVATKIELVDLANQATEPKEGE